MKPIGALIDGLAAGVSVRAVDGDTTRPAVLKTSAVKKGAVDLGETKAIVAQDVGRAKQPLVKDALIFSRMNTPALVGAVGYVAAEEDGVFLPDRLWLARARAGSGNNMRWLAHVLGFGDVASGIRELATGTSNSMKNIPKSRLLDFEISVPPVAEQNEMASALTSADSFIAALERLVAKKRAFKQGLMQQLLTARVRLPAFSGEWAVRKIGAFAEVTTGGTPSTAVSRYWGGDIRWMNSGEIHKKHVSEVAGRITDEGLRNSNARLLPSGTVLMALVGQGKTRGTVAISEVDLTINQSMAGILPGREHDPDFLYYNLDTRYGELRGESSGQGGRGVLNLGIIRDLEVLMPQLDEQKAIGALLRAADAEIEALEQRVSVACYIKQGMMQELLTGRTRLVPEGAMA